MENYKNELTSLLSKIDRRHIQWIVVILTLSMLVIAAGAPGAFGDFTGAPGFGGH
jgi:hypothetical protein